MKKLLLCKLLLTLLALKISTQAKEYEVPIAQSKKTKVIQFAGPEHIKHPIGMTFTIDGKLLVVESHTHLRPKTYNGPETDQIIWLSDTDGDGKADKREVFYEGNLRASMNIATHPQTGAIYVATKTGIHRLWDRDGDGKAEESERVIFFEFESEFLDNGYGCAGLAFDKKGNLLFGIGGLLGAPYKLESSDGIKFADQGEGGNIWHCTRDGEKLRRYSTGFWNPFGLCHTPEGFIFATDNDPSSRPPSRLHYVIDGGDYGYQFRYGKSGHHPFIAWDGELPGSLPMLSGTGDAPCDVIFHKNNLIVTSWSDHQVEIYPLSWNKTHFKTDGPSILLKGGHEFRPVGMTVAADDALYISDWVKQDYQLHGEGAIWKVVDWELEEPVRHEWASKRDPEDPWTFAKMVSGEQPKLAMSHEREQIFNLLHSRFHNKPNSRQLISKALQPDQENEDLRLLAYKWIADQRLKGFENEVFREVNEPASSKLFHAAITTKARIEGLNVMDEDMEKLLTKELDSPSSLVRRTAFLLLEDRNKVAIDQLKKIYSAGDEAMRSGVAITLRKHSQPKEAESFAREIAATDSSQKVRALASLAFAKDDGGQIRPSNPHDLGEFLFHENCAQCHRVGGFGRKGGPDLSRIGVRGREHILQSVVNPSAELAPMYETWKVTMADGKEHMGFVLGEKASIHYYSDASGNLFEVNTTMMANRERLPVSLMPANLNKQMGEHDFSFLLNWLTQLR